MSGFLNRQINQFRAIISFFTLLPVAPKAKLEASHWAGSLKYLSVVALLYGLLNIIILFFIGEQRPYLLALIIVLANLFLSGGLHMDGLMDSFDGIAASKKTRAETLGVMKDSRVGAFGAMAGMVVLLVQVISLAQIDYHSNFYLVALLLLLLPIMSRFVSLLVIHFQVEEQTGSLALFKSVNTKRKIFVDILVSFFVMKITALVFLLKYPLSFSELMLCDFMIVPWLIVSWFIFLYLRRKLQGHNGDSLGAGLMLNETSFYLLLAFVCG